MTDRIRLLGLTFYGYHGARPEEKILGQRFGADVELELDLAAAGRADDLAHSVDYSQAFALVQEVLEGPSLKTLEAVAEVIAARLLERFERVSSVLVRVRKPAAPIAGALTGQVEIEVARRRGGAA